MIVEQPFQSMLDEASLRLPDTLVRSVGQLMTEKNLTIALAESLTGGMVSKQLSDLPGASQFFIGSVVCYHPRLKVQLCRVNAATIREHGIVSEAVAREMALGIQQVAGSDISISTTGYAGPSAPELDAGKVYVGFAIKNQLKVKFFRFDGNRDTVRIQTTMSALGYLKQYLLNLDS